MLQADQQRQVQLVGVVWAAIVLGHGQYKSPMWVWVYMIGAAVGTLVGHRIHTTHKYSAPTQFVNVVVSMVAGYALYAYQESVDYRSVSHPTWAFLVGLLFISMLWPIWGLNLKIESRFKLNSTPRLETP